MRELTLGCIGCGFIADIHLRNARKMPGVRIRAVADIREEAARSYHQQYGSEYWTTTPRRLFDDPALDAVLICTYPTSHAELAISAARGGKHIFLEKPMATSSAECLEIIRACRTNGITLALDLKFRFSEAALEVKREIARPVVVVSQTSTEEVSEDDERTNSGPGGAIVQDLGAHLLDLACFFAGSEPVRIFAQGNRLPHRRTQMLDIVAGTLEFQSGCVGSFLITDCAEWPHASKWFFEVGDGRRNAVIHNHCRTALLSGDVNRMVDGSDVPPHETGAFESLADFVEAVREERPPKVGSMDGLRFAIMSEAMLESIRSGRAILLKGPEGGEPWHQCAYAGAT
jgi:predicted dehydrogenase